MSNKMRRIRILDETYKIFACPVAHLNGVRLEQSLKDEGKKANANGYIKHTLE
jgi:hypothetical protein